jgi:glycosyltransferase involved in cell wall biosynthesis
MKIYFVAMESPEQLQNYFVSSLAAALQEQGQEVVCGVDRLWTDDVFDCDIVHFQWPELIFGDDKKEFSDSDITRTCHRLALLKEKGIKVFVQVHNLKPHENKDKNILRLYNLLYQQADVTVHMGNYSRDLLQPQYPHARHVVIPHHIYDNVYRFDISRETARQRLHLPRDKRIVLSFGKFRNDEERRFVLSLKRKYSSSEKNPPLFLMPGFYRKTLHTWNPKKFITRLFYTVNYKLKGVRFCHSFIPDDLMQCYFCAADVVLLQRLEILNSGNLPMAFAAGKVVVGPNVGNVGEILREMGNFTFDPQHTETAVEALRKALDNIAKGEEYKAYAMKHWSSDIIANQLLKHYSNVL